MCGYILLANPCGCFGPLVSDTSCSNIFGELERINTYEAWEPDMAGKPPFQLPDECLPGWHNTKIIPSRSYCPQYWLRCPAVLDPERPFIGTSNTKAN